MAHEHVISARVDAATLARIDAFVAKLRAKAKGAPVTRHAATQIIIEHGLRAVEPKVKK